MRLLVRDTLSCSVGFSLGRTYGQAWLRQAPHVLLNGVAQTALSTKNPNINIKQKALLLRLHMHSLALHEPDEIASNPIFHRTVPVLNQDVLR